MRIVDGVDKTLVPYLKDGYKLKAIKYLQLDDKKIRIDGLYETIEDNLKINQKVCALVHGGGYAEYCKVFFTTLNNNRRRNFLNYVVKKIRRKKLIIKYVKMMSRTSNIYNRNKKEITELGDIKI